METVWIVLSQLLIFHTVSGSTVNLALRKPTSASTMQFRYSAGTAVDGNTVANGQDPKKIIWTQPFQAFAWWKVDLQRFVLNATVRIYFRTDDKLHRKGVKLYTSTSSFSSYPEGRLCHTVTGDPSGSDIPDVYSVPCSGRWRYLLLYTDTSNLGKGKVLDFGEVQVFEPPCDNGYYGLNCDKLCSDRKCKAPSTSSCDRLTGRCPDGCEAGWRQEDCTQECRSGFYGPGCSSSCSARMCLIGSSDCNHVIGQCVGGCSPGYRGTDCKQECETGVYGPGCSLACTDRKCLDPSSKCDHVTGHCKCKPGYNGTDCKQKCGSNFYGQDCRLSCTDRKCRQSSSQCNHVTGQCVGGCQAGYNGTSCITECPRVTYGVNCERSCTDRHCLTSQRQCDPQTGQCPGVCEPGWTGVDCATACPGGSFGVNCTEKCGECGGVCDSVDGRCPAGCLEGFNGTWCNVSLGVISATQPVDNIVPAAAGGAAALVVLAIVVVIVVLYRRRRKHPKSKGDSQSIKSHEKNGTIVLESFRQDEVGDAGNENSSNQTQINKPEAFNTATSVLSKTHKQKVKATTNKESKSDDEDDQSEEILDEEEAPTSTPYYNLNEDDVIREVAVEDLAATVQRIQSREGGFEAEYNRLPTGFTATYADSQKEENAGKNKFRGYYPYDHNRVRLSLLPDVPGSDYINASIMHNYSETKTYIAAQAPKKMTLGDFWRMIWELGCGRVVMLTGLVEERQEKCYQYWPENDLLTTDLFRVTLEEPNTRANYTIRTLKVEKIETGESRNVVQYHYTTWPDHGVPDTLALVNFIWMMRRTHTRTDGPMLVHCSAGIGRTGTYIAVDSLLDQAREEGKVDVQGYVSMMRGQRKNMIQTKFQYECVFNCLVEMTKYGNTSLPVDDFTTLYTNSGMDARVDSDGKSFRELTQLMLTEQVPDCPVKNRMWVDGDQAFTVRSAPSLRSVRGHLLCESPHPGQEKLLWKLVEENNVNNVIVIDKPQTKLAGEIGTTKRFGTFKITRKKETKLTDDICLSALMLQEPIQEKKQSVQLVEVQEGVPLETLLISLLQHTKLKLSTSDLSSRVVIHSSTDRKVGVMFCVLGNLMSEIQEDETVDVLHQVRTFTRIFPDIRLTQDDVKQLFDFARRCAQLTASTYANM